MAFIRFASEFAPQSGHSSERRTLQTRFHSPTTRKDSQKFHAFTPCGMESGATNLDALVRCSTPPLVSRRGVFPASHRCMEENKAEGKFVVLTWRLVMRLW